MTTACRIPLLAALVLSTLLTGVVRAAGDVPVELPRLMADLAGGTPKARIAAAKALHQLGPQQGMEATTLVAALKDDYWDVREETAALLQAIGLPAVPALRQVLTAPDYYSRYYAARTLGRIGASDDATVLALAAMLQDRSMDLRVTAAEALVQAGPQCRLAVPALGRALRDSSPDVRTLASRAIALAGDKAVPELLKALGDPAEEARVSAVQALGDIGPNARAAVPTLLPLVSATESPLCCAAMEALLKIDSAAVVPQLAQLLASPDEASVRWLVRLCGGVKTNQKAVVPLLVTVLGTGKDRWHRAAGADALATMGPGAESATPALVQALADAEECVPRYAIKALTAIGVRTVPALTEALKDPRVQVRVNAVRALVSLGATNGRAVQSALQAAANDADPTVKAEATKALTTLYGA